MKLKKQDCSSKSDVKTTETALNLYSINQLINQFSRFTFTYLDFVMYSSHPSRLTQSNRTPATPHLPAGVKGTIIISIDYYRSSGGLLILDVKSKFSTLEQFRFWSYFPPINAIRFLGRTITTSRLRPFSIHLHLQLQIQLKLHPSNTIRYIVPYRIRASHYDDCSDSNSSQLIFPRSRHASWKPQRLFLDASSDGRETTLDGFVHH